LYTPVAGNDLGGLYTPGAGDGLGGREKECRVVEYR